MHTMLLVANLRAKQLSWVKIGEILQVPAKDIQATYHKHLRNTSCH